MLKIGFVGLGHMGLPMSLHLFHANYPIIAYDIQQTARDAFQQTGGVIASNLRAVANGCDVLITMLQTGAQVLEVCLGKKGLFAAMKKHSLYIDCSTIAVNDARTLHHAAQQHQLLSLDAPVSGGVAGAEAGTLTLMVGGEESALMTAKPLLQRFAKTIIHAGPAGTGQAAKICNNMMLGISMIAASEAFQLADTLGLSHKKLHEVVTHASGHCWVMDHYVPVPGVLDNVPANKDYQPGFTAAMMLKDLKLSQDAAMAHGIQTSMGQLATSLYHAFAEQGHANLDFSAILQVE